MKDISLSDNPLEHRMESLESKLDRLTPEQRKEVEEFVDFLLHRSGKSHESPGTSPVPLDFKNVAPPPFIVQEPVHTPNNIPINGDEMIPAENITGPVLAVQVTPFHEISSADDDRITRDYMDYGQYEQQSSPAISAVKNVKEKLKKQEKQEKPRVSLDWID